MGRFCCSISCIYALMPCNIVHGWPDAIMGKDRVIACHPTVLHCVLRLNYQGVDQVGVPEWKVGVLVSSETIHSPSVWPVKQCSVWVEDHHGRILLLLCIIVICCNCARYISRVLNIYIYGINQNKQSRALYERLKKKLRPLKKHPQKLVFGNFFLHIPI